MKTMSEETSRPQQKKEPRPNDNDISMVIKYRDIYTTERKAIINKIFNMRPAETLALGAMKFESKKYIECVDHMAEKILSRPCAPDYYHQALGYISLCFGRMDLLVNANLILEEMRKVKYPPEYKDFAKALEDKLVAEIENVKSEKEHIRKELEDDERRKKLKFQKRKRFIEGHAQDEASQASAEQASPENEAAQ